MATHRLHRRTHLASHHTHAMRMGDLPAASTLTYAPSSFAPPRRSMHRVGSICACIGQRAGRTPPCTRRYPICHNPPQLQRNATDGMHLLPTAAPMEANGHGACPTCGTAVSTPYRPCTLGRTRARGVERESRTVVVCTTSGSQGLRAMAAARKVVTIDVVSVGTPSVCAPRRFSLEASWHAG